MTDDGPLLSLSGVSRSATHLWVDGHIKDLGTLEEYVHLQSLSLYRLSKINIPILANLSLPKLTSFGLRLAPLSDFRAFSQFKSLVDLSIWQCSKLRSLEGLGALSKLKLLYVSDLGSPLSIQSIEQLPELEKLYISGSMNAPQKIVTFSPISKIGRKLSVLELCNTQPQDKQLQSLAQIPEPDAFSLTPWLFPLEEVAWVAAAYPKWRGSLMNMGVEHFKTCSTCGGRLRQTFASRSRAKCPSCEAIRFKEFEQDFLTLVQKKINLLEGK